MFIVKDEVVDVIYYKLMSNIPKLKFLIEYLYFIYFFSHKCVDNKTELNTMNMNNEISVSLIFY